MNLFASGVYIYHMDRPVSDRHTCQHYIGSAENIAERDRLHRSGQGSRLLQVANEKGIDYRIVRIWESPPTEMRKLERRIKDRRNGPRYCPVCAEADRHEQIAQVHEKRNLPMTITFIEQGIGSRFFRRRDYRSRTTALRAGKLYRDRYCQHPLEVWIGDDRPYYNPTRKPDHIIL